MEWHPAAGLENGHLRFTVRNAPTKAPPKYDPNSVELWGFKKDPLMALVAAAVQARLPHPARATGTDVADARPSCLPLGSRPPRTTTTPSCAACANSASSITREC